jgi:hypothetical protein
VALPPVETRRSSPAVPDRALALVGRRSAAPSPSSGPPRVAAAAAGVRMPVPPRDDTFWRMARYRGSLSFSMARIGEAM